MLTGDLIPGVHYYDQNPIRFPVNFSMNSNFDPTHFNNLLTSLPPPPNAHDFTASQNSCLSSAYNSSTSDEADQEHQTISIVDERKQRRMISNRESARRSRMRKQKHLDLLWSQLSRLRSENHSLVDKLTHVSQRHDRALQENAKLKEETAHLREMLNDPFTYALRELDPHIHQHIPCNNTSPHI